MVIQIPFRKAQKPYRHAKKAFIKPFRKAVRHIKIDSYTSDVSPYKYVDHSNSSLHRKRVETETFESQKFWSKLTTHFINNDATTHGDSDDCESSTSWMLLSSVYAAGLLTAGAAVFLWRRHYPKVKKSLTTVMSGLLKSTAPNLSNVEDVIGLVTKVLHHAVTFHAILHMASMCYRKMDWACLFALVLDTSFGRQVSDSFVEAISANTHGFGDICEIVKVFITFFATLITGSVKINTVTNFFRWAGFTGVGDAMKKSSEEFAQFISYYVLKFFVWVTLDKVSYLKDLTHEFENKQEDVAILRTMPIVISELTSHVADFGSGKYKNCTIQQMRIIYDVLTRASRLLQLLAKSKKMNVAHYNIVKHDHAKLLENYRKRKIEMLASKRIEPTTIYLVGPPGVGKSTLMPFIAKKIGDLAYTADMFEGDYTYSRDSESRHWNGYKNQPIITIDDAFQGCKGPNALDFGREFIQMVSVVPMRVERAEIEEKGAMFTSELILMSSNYPNPTTSSNRGALMRRLAQNYIVMLKNHKDDVFAGDFSSVSYFKWTGRGPLAFSGSQTAPRTVDYPLPTTVLEANADAWFKQNFTKITHHQIVADACVSIARKTQLLSAEPSIVDQIESDVPIIDDNIDADDLPVTHMLQEEQYSESALPPVHHAECQCTPCLKIINPNYKPDIPSCAGTTLCCCHNCVRPDLDLFSPIQQKMRENTQRVNEWASQYDAPSVMETASDCSFTDYAEFDTTNDEAIHSHFLKIRSRPDADEVALLNLVSDAGELEFLQRMAIRREPVFVPFETTKRSSSLGDSPLSPLDGLRAIEFELDINLKTDINTILSSEIGKSLIKIGTARSFNAFLKLSDHDKTRLTTLPQDTTQEWWTKHQPLYSMFCEYNTDDAVVRFAMNEAGNLIYSIDGETYLTIGEVPVEYRAALYRCLRAQYNMSLGTLEHLVTWNTDGTMSRMRFGMTFLSSSGRIWGPQNGTATKISKVILAMNELYTPQKMVWTDIKCVSMRIREILREFVHSKAFYVSAIVALALVLAVALNVILVKVWKALWGLYKGQPHGNWYDNVESASGRDWDDVMDEADPIEGKFWYEMGDEDRRGGEIRPKKGMTEKEYNEWCKKMFGSVENYKQYRKSQKKGKSHGDTIHSGVTHGVNSIVDEIESPTTGERLVDLFCHNYVRARFTADQGWSVTLNGICVGGGNVIFPKHFLAECDQSTYKINVQCDEVSFDEEVPRSSIRFASELKLTGFDLKNIDLCAVNFRGMAIRKMITKHISCENIHFSLFSSAIDAAVVKPRFSSETPRVSYMCPVTTIKNMTDFTYSNSRATYKNKLYLIEKMGMISALGAGDCGSLLLTRENGQIKICGLYVAGNSDTNYFQPITRTLVEALIDFTGVCRGLEDFPPVKGVPSSLCSYPMPAIGTYAFDKPSLRNIPRTDIRKSVIGVNNPNMFGHPTVVAPAVMTIESAQKAMLKKYHEPGTFDETILAQAAHYVKTLYKSKIRDCQNRGVEGGLTGVSPYGVLAPLDMNTSPGLPWTAMKPASAKGKRWMFKDDGSPKPKLQEALDKCETNWSHGIANPCVFNGSLKDERRPEDRVKAKKTRIFTAGPVEKTILDRGLFADFIIQYKANRLDLGHCYGIDAEGLEWNKMIQMHRAMGSKHVGFDYSGFDASLSSVLLRRAYDVIADFFPDSSDKLRIDCSASEAANHFVYMFGDLYHAFQGNPSGQTMTTIVNSIVNHLLLTYSWIKHFSGTKIPEMADYAHWRANYVVHVYGDDFIYTVSDLAESFGGLKLSECLKPLGVTVTATDKSETLSDFIPFSELTLLKRFFIKNPYGSTNIYVGPLEKAVIEEIPKWRWDGGDDSAFMNTLTCALRSATLWGREYYAWYLAQLRSCSQIEHLMSMIDPEDILADVTQKFGVVFNKVESQDVHAFFMSDPETRASDKFLSNLANVMFEYKPSWSRKEPVIFNSVEQAYQMEKAHMAGDKDSFKALRSYSPFKCAHFGHSIRRCDQWNDHKINAMTQIVEAKFSVDAMKEKLLATTGLIAEASTDKFWGTGLSVSVTRMTPPHLYPGKNILGSILMARRQKLRET